VAIQKVDKSALTKTTTSLEHFILKKIVYDPYVHKVVQLSRKKVIWFGFGLVIKQDGCQTILKPDDLSGY
jgi:hypothetical protein